MPAEPTPSDLTPESLPVTPEVVMWIPPEPSAVVVVEAEPEVQEAPSPATDPAPTPLDLAEGVARLFAERCHECHGTGKRPKGGLRLSDMPRVLARPAEEALIVAGAPERSPLFARLVLPAEHEDLMPPEDGPLAPAELALVRQWIEAGAPWNAAPVADEGVSTEPIAALDAEQRAARDAALARLVARGAYARRLSATSEAVEVDLAVALPRATGADLALLAGLEPCLVELSLARTALSEAELAPLAAFGELRRLRLDHVPVGDGALAALSDLTKLEALNLYATRLTPAAVPALARFTALRRLYLGATGLGPEALAELARALPECVLVGDAP